MIQMVKAYYLAKGGQSLVVIDVEQSEEGDPTQIQVIVDQSCIILILKQCSRSCFSNDKTNQDGDKPANGSDFC